MVPPETGTDKLVGMQFGDYRLQRLLATGGMARIYEAVDINLNRTVAIKLLNIDGNPDTTLAHRFQREARAVARLDHDHIVSIFKYGEALGYCYIAMKLIDGKDLAQEISRLRRLGQRMTPARALFILEQIASALDFAHAQGIIHRDIKPSNILMGKEDRAYLTDFGLLLQSTGDSTKTKGTAFGTPRYIAPEQALASQNAVPQSDIYALAVILYEILTGEAPFSGETPMEIALGHIGDPPRPPRSLNPKIPHAVERELLRALEKEPVRRHATATDFIRSVKAGYGLQDAVLAAAAPQVTEAAPASMPRVMEDVSTAHVPTTMTPAEAPARPRKRSWGLLLIGLLVIGLVGLGVLILNNQSNAGLNNGSAVLLTYNQDWLVIQNQSEEDQDFFAIQFIRGIDGEGRDDFSGDRIAGENIIPAGQCYALGLLGAQTPLPNGCTRLRNFEVLNQPTLFFWRREAVDASTFQVRFNRELVVECPTIAANDGPKTCAFEWSSASQATAAP